MQQKKENRKYIWLVAIIALIIGVGIVLAVIFGLFQKQVVHDNYDVAFKMNNKTYEVFPIAAADIGIDKKKKDKDMYFRINSYYDLEYLFRTAYHQYEISKPADRNKYDGALDYNIADTSYVMQKNVHHLKKDTYAVYSLHNKKGKEIYRYDPENTSTDPYIIRIKPTILQHYKKNKISSYDDFVNITKLFKDKLGKQVTVKVDDKQKMITFSIK